MDIRQSIITAIDQQAKDLPRKRVPDSLHGWGIPLWIRTMSAAERDAWEIGWLHWRQTKNGDVEDVRGFEAYLLVHTLADEQGRAVLTDDDVATLGKAPAPVIGKLARLAMRLNGIGKDDVEELLKNCDSSPSECSGTTSPSPSGGGQ